MNGLSVLLGDEDKRLILLLLVVLMREKADRAVIFALLYILFA